MVSENLLLYIIFSNSSWPQMTETMEHETVAKETITVFYFMPSNFELWDHKKNISP